MNTTPHIIFFDGVCNLCNASVQYVIKRDKKNVFRFAALQSHFADTFFKQYQFERHTDSIVLFNAGKFYTESTAALLIARQLSYPAKFWYAAIVMPKGIRNPIYRFIARNRYKWFGKQESCMIPTVNIANKFLDT